MAKQWVGIEPTTSSFQVDQTLEELSSMGEPHNQGELTISSIIANRYQVESNHYYKLTKPAFCRWTMIPKEIEPLTGDLLDHYSTTELHLLKGYLISWVTTKRLTQTMLQIGCK